MLRFKVVVYTFNYTFNFILALVCHFRFIVVFLLCFNVRYMHFFMVSFVVTGSRTV